MSTTTMARVVNGLPLTEVNGREYTYGIIAFVKPMSFWHAQSPTGMGAPFFSLADAVQDARSRGWVHEPVLCHWCRGYGVVRLTGVTLAECHVCNGEGTETT